MNDIRILTPLAALVGMVLIAGCDQGQGDRKSGASRADTAVAQQEQSRGNDPMQPRGGLMEDAKRAAEQVAASGKDTAGKSPESAGQTPGKPAEAMNDAAISAAVKSALAADPQLAALKIGVDSQAGVVTLTGRAPNANVADRAVQVAATAKGVMKVENQLMVEEGKS
jgi:osmotically-inducible protein OsmY